jgi:hypothetical protein
LILPSHTKEWQALQWSHLYSALTCFLLFALLPLSLGACGSAGNANGSSSTSVATSAATKAPLRLSTDLCANMITTTEVGQAIGASIRQVEPQTEGDTGVACIYSTDDGSIELIVFEIEPNAAALFPNLKQENANSTWKSITDLNGLGDAAFWSVISSTGSAADATITGLAVLKGTLILQLIFKGVSPATLASEEQMARLILGRV